MAVPTQKSIIITTSLPTLAKTKTNSLLIAGNINPAVVEGLGTGDGYKKRKRLTHLTPDERLLRRKLKNRVAAQTARDKKKARMDELEEAVSLLADENKRLQAENEKLKQKSGTLAKENDTLKEQLGIIPPGTEPNKVTESRESAAGTGSEALLGISASSEGASSLQSDVLAGLWRELQEAAAAVAEEDASEADNSQTHQQTTSAQDAQVVGPTTAELESIKELIHFDHEYIKPAQIHLTPANTTATTTRNTTTTTRAVAAPARSLVKSNGNHNRNNKSQKMVSVVNVNISANPQPEPLNLVSNEPHNCISNSLSQQTVTPDASLDLPEFFENVSEDILNFNTDLMKDLDFDKLLNSAIIDSQMPVEVNKQQQQQQQALSSSLSQDNPRKRKCSDVVDTSTANLAKQSKTDDFCFQTVVKFDDIFIPHNEIKTESVSELSEAGSPASVVSSSSSHDDLWEESFSELFPTLI